ncbi:MAG: hypothetical protein ACYCPP_06525 [Nitrososphaerales archaeon]
MSIEVTIAGEKGELDLKRISSAQRQVRNLVSKGQSVLVKINSGGSGKTQLEYAKKYTGNVQDVRKAIRKTNCLLMIAALRSAKVPTHTSAFDDKRKATAFLKKKGIPRAAVV